MRLIDANAIKYREYRGGGGREYPENIATEYEIAKLPTVDAVEVIRCKDCKYRRNEIECPMCFEEEKEWDDDGYTEVDWITHDRTQDDGFCHRGERKDK